MRNIKLLPPEVYNKIAAGEVVERPASVVKELLENSIDAGASAVSVEIWDGGQKIIVSDNGGGIPCGDVKNAFMPHATSKIDNADDLFALSTLGFRGEALASIAAVSSVTMITRTKDAETGIKISIKGGFIEYFEEKGSPQGTYITVENLFYNVPARSKFLKSARSEENEITNIVSRLILANPTVSVKYSADGEKVYHSDGRGVKSAVYAVYGAQAAENSLPVAFENDNLKITGYVGKPEFFKPNRTWQTLIINGRYVIDYRVSKAVSDVFEGYLMKHQYPFYVLYIEIDKSLIDVNVHPNKLEVRFVNLYNAANALKKAISAALDGDKSVVSVRSGGGNLPAADELRGETAAAADGAGGLRGGGAGGGSLYELFAGKERGELRESSAVLRQILSEDKEIQQSFETSGGAESAAADNGFSFGRAAVGNGAAAGSGNSVNETIIGNGAAAAPADVSVFPPAASAKIIGIIFDTYIVAEAAGSVYLIDQHAAHERLLYDRMRSDMENRQGASQSMLMPYLFKTNPQETRLVLENIPLVSETGFEIERFGTGEFRVTAVPAALSDIDLAAFVNTMLSDTAFFKLENKDALKERLMQAACKAAVKAGDKLSPQETETILKQIAEDDINLRCPHGRPIIIRLEKAEIEKWFKRKI